MLEDTNLRPRLRLIRGGLECSISFGLVRIVAAPKTSPPFDVEALAFEEDTWLIMSADPKICEPEEHPIRLMTEFIEEQPKPIGSVLVTGRNPIRFLAIVHDVNQVPTLKEEWVESALKEIFEKAEQRKIRSLGLPLLGTLHGRLEKQRFVALLSRSLIQSSFKFLRCIWLITPAGESLKIINSLESILNGQCVTTNI